MRSIISAHGVRGGKKEFVRFGFGLVLFTFKPDREKSTKKLNTVAHPKMFVSNRDCHH